MKYLLLVSHGEFSKGLKQTLSMFAKDSMDAVIAVGLKPGESIEDFGKKFEQLVSTLPEKRQFVVLADIIGGSPLTTVCNILNNHGDLDGSVVLGGMNFPMALTALLSKDTMDSAQLKQTVLSEASKAVKELKIQNDESLDDDI